MRHLEDAYTRLDKWVHTQCYIFSKDSHFGLFKQVIQVFKQRPLFLQYNYTINHHERNCLEEISIVRREVLKKRFVIALTKGHLNLVNLILGSDDGIMRPIEIHAHDPLRYVGDMYVYGK